MDENILIIEEPKEEEIILEKESIVFKESLRAEDVLFDDGKSLQFKFENGELKGEPGEQGEKGDAYVLTDTDKQEIAQMVLNELPNAEGVEY